MSGSLLPNITRASLTQPLYAAFGSGGGGGSGQSTFTVSTLTVSELSIAGAPPPVDITAGISKFSTISAASLDVGAGGVIMNNTTLSWDNNATAGTYWDAGISQLFTVVPDNSIVHLGTQNNPFSLSVGVSSVNTNTVFVGPSVSTLSLLVSSVNGGPYPPQGSGTVSTIGFSAANFPGGNGTVPLNNTPIAITDSFAVDPTHRYRVSYEAAYNNNDGTGSFTTVYMSGTSPVHYFQTVTNAPDSTPSLNDARASMSGVFVPNSSPCQLVAANSSAVTQTSITFNNVAGVVLEDLGAI